MGALARVRAIPPSSINAFARADRAGAAAELLARGGISRAATGSRKSTPVGDRSDRRTPMARKSSPSASKDVANAMRRRKQGTLKRGKAGRGGTVKSRKQAIAIGLSEARKKGKKVPKRRTSRK